jgi:hypothetical protein
MLKPSIDPFRSYPIFATPFIPKYKMF